LNALGNVWAKSRSRPGEVRGELLTEHLIAARDAARMLQQRVGRIAGVPETFWESVILACLAHDAGKIPAGFQRMLGNPGPASPWGQRHEVYSLGFAACALSWLPADQLDWVMTGVASHHRPLQGDRSLKQLLNSTYRSPEDLINALGTVDPLAAGELHAWLLTNAGAPGSPAPSLEELAHAAHRQLRNVIDRWASPFSSDPARDLAGVLVQGAVTLADHVASAHTELLACQPADAGYGKALTARLERDGKTLFPHQEQALAAAGHMLLRAPTGQGKTEAALLWASRQVGTLRELTGGIPRVFYTLPYLASINAMTGRLEEEFNAAGKDLIGVAHSHAASYYLRLAADDCGDISEDADELAARAARRALARNQATRLFREPLRVGTPYQLVRGALAGPAHAGILIDAANSVFILDELHAYEPRRLGMILAMVRLWTRLGGKVGVVSATLPAALADLLATALSEQPSIVEPPDGWTWPVRHQLELRGGHLTAPPAVTEISGRLRGGRSVLVVANNVADARELFRQLSPQVISQHGQDAAMLLHSRYRAVDRAAIERRILRRFEAGEPRRPGLLVATQTVEVSLNVDFDALHTSGAPLESLIQRFGRINRLGKLAAPAPVVVHEPAYGPRRGQAASDYADGVYDAEPVRLGWQILARHDALELDEKIFGCWLDEIYATGWGQRWRADVESSYQHWDRDWLQFTQPFDNRDQLADDFDRLFEGTEAVLESDAGEYRRRLNEHRPGIGRLLAAELLLPVPAYGSHLGRWDKALGVTVIDADYDEALGLLKIHGRNGSRYIPGEVL
jgi:CRISPR-associated helicase Cas3/CRISPR-associated endonuclease Cas3-HD